MSKLIKKVVIASLATVGMLSVAFAAYPDSRGKSILEYHYMSGSTVVGEQVVNQCTGSVYTSGQVTSTKILFNSEPCGSYNLASNHLDATVSK
jgi:hypothetical protein